MRKISKILLMIVFACSLCCLYACESKIVDMQVENIPTVYYGEDFNTKDIKITITRKNKKTETITDLSDVKISEINTTTIGEQDLTITYEKFSKKFKVNIVGVSSIEISGLPEKVLKGENVDLSTITAVATFEDKTTRNLGINDLVVSEIDTSTIGKQTYTITYKNKVENKEINVIDITNVSINDFKYIEKEEKLDLTDKKATITFSDETTKIIDATDLTVGDIDTTISSDKTLLITYKGRTFTQNINVYEIISLEIIGNIPSIKYGSEGIINYNNVTNIKVNYSNNTSKLINVSDLKAKTERLDNTTEAGEKNISISYKYFTQNDIKVLVTDKPIIENIVLTGYEKVVKVNHIFTLDNLLGVVKYPTDEQKDDRNITKDDMIIEGTVDTTIVGNYTLNIKYSEEGFEDYKTSITINVVGVSKIEIVGDYKKTIRLGEEYDINNIKTIKVIYTDKIFEEISKEDFEANEVVIENIDNKLGGQQTLKITYNGYTENSIKINVIVASKITIENLPTKVLVNEKIDFNTKVITITFADNTTKVAKYSDLIIKNIDTTTIGEKTLTVSYYDYTEEFVINVVDYKEIVLLGTYETEVESCSIYDKSGITGAKIIYTDDSEIEVNLSDIILSDVDTMVNNNVTYLTVTYKNFAYNIEITLNQQVIIGFDTPESISKYNTNKTDTTGNVSFTIADKIYNVGSDNSFVLTPQITDYLGETVKMTKTDITFKVSDDNEHFTDIENTSEYIESIGEINVNVKFNTNAINKYFKMTVYPRIDHEIGSFTIRFKVVKGYNVYNAKDLAVVDNNKQDWATIKAENNLTNVNTDAVILHDTITITKDDVPTTAFWTEQEVKQAGLKEEIVGSLKEPSTSTFIYIRKIKNNEQFTIYGNYFTIDVSQIPLCKYNADGYTAEDHAITMHASLFGFLSDDNTLNAKTSINDTFFKGNTQRSDSGILSGGLLLFKTKFNTMKCENTAFQNWFIGYMFEYCANTVTINGETFVITDADTTYYTFTKDGTTYYLNKEDNKVYSEVSFENQVFENFEIEIDRPFNEVNNSKGFECYNSHFYLWGSQLNIRNSVMKSAGGPVMIVDHVASGNESEKKSGKNGVPSYVYIYNSDLESRVSGQEPWFITYGATALVAGMTSTNTYFNSQNQVLQSMTAQKDNIISGLVSMGYSQSQATDLVNQKLALMKSGFMTGDGVKTMNLVAIYKSGSAEGVTTFRVRGEIKYMDQNKSLLLGGDVYNNSVASGEEGKQSFIFENSNNSHIFDTARGIMGYDTNTLEAFSSRNATGRTYLNTYIFNGMGLVLELFPNA